MTVSAGATKTTQSCDGSLTDFDFSFVTYKEEDIAVIIKHIATEEETLLVLNTDYTVASDNFADGGTVSTIKEINEEIVSYAWSTDYSITIMLNLALIQETDLLYGGNFSSEAIERTVDRLTLIAQQLDETIKRTIKLRKTSALTDIEIDDLEAGKFIVVNAAGDALEMGTVAGEPGQLSISNNPYNKDTWNSITDIAASKNAIRDELFNNRFTKGATYSMIIALGGSGGNYSDPLISNEIYGTNWNGDVSMAASKNAIYDKIESIGTGSGDVIGPATNVIDYVPQWLSNNSKTLKNGFPITAAGKAILDDASVAAQRTTLGLASAALRTAEDTLTDGSNLPDGHAIKVYGDDNWSEIGSGDVTGPGSSIDNAIPLWSGIAGKVLQDSTRLMEDTLTDGANLPDGHAIKTYGDANWGGKTNLTEFLEQTAWRLFYSNADGDVIELALGTAGQYLRASGVAAVPTWAVPTGEGDVLGPGVNIDNYVPQWNGANSKTLKNGFPITAAGKSLLDDTTVAVMRTTLELASAALRTAEDTLTDGANLPDGHAIKTYGDANWGGSAGDLWTDGGTYIYGTAEAGNTRLHDSGQLEIGATGGTNAPLITADKWGFSSGVTEGARRLLILDGTEDHTLTPTAWIEKLYQSNSSPSGDPTIPVGLYVAHKHTGSGTGFTHSIMAYALNSGTGNNDAIAISGRARKKGAGAGDACGIWGSAYNDVNQNGGIMGLESSIYQNAAGMVAGDRLDSKWSVSLHVMGSSTGSPAKAGIAIDAANTHRFWNGIIIDKDCFAGTEAAGTVGINMGSFDANRCPQYAIKFGKAGTHLYCNYGDLTFYDPVTGAKTLAQLASGNGGSGDVIGPASHPADYVPMWNGTPNSKTLIDGFFITALGKNLLNDATTAAMRSTLVLGSASQRNSEDTLTDGSNLPDGHAIKTYGDANWGGSGSSKWTDAETHVYPNNWSNFKLYDSGKLDMASSQWVYDDDSISYTGIGCSQIHRYNQLIKNFSMNDGQDQVLARIEGKSSGGHDALALMTAIQLTGIGQGWGSNPMIDIESGWQPSSTKWAVGEEIDLNLRSNTSNGLSQGLMITGVSNYAPTVGMTISMGGTDWKDGIWMCDISDNGIVFSSNPAPGTGIRFDHSCSNANFWQVNGDMKFHDPNAGTKTLSQLSGGGDVVDDTTPQLGGYLDLNGYDIYGVGNITLNNNYGYYGKNTLGVNKKGLCLNSGNNWEIGQYASGVSLGYGCSNANPIMIRVNGTNDKQILRSSDTDSQGKHYLVVT